MKELEPIFRRGTMPDADSLFAWEFRGMNTPKWAKYAGIKKFIKGFYKRDDQLFGYNIPVVQNRVTQAWISKPSDENPKRFGFYRVDAVDPTAVDNKYLQSLLLDYGRGGNKMYDPTSGLRDYVIQVDPDNPDLYLGKAYYALGPLRLATNFFVLERHREGVEALER